MRKSFEEILSVTHKSIIISCQALPVIGLIKRVYEGYESYITPTMSGYTPYSPKIDGPDFELAARLAEDIDIPVIAEGKIHYPEQAKRMLASGVHAVVVGGAITRPLEIAQRFYKEL